MHTKKANNGRRCRSKKKSDSILLSFFDKKSNKKHMNFASSSEGRQAGPMIIELFVLRCCCI